MSLNALPPSEADFLRSCMTSVGLIPGFSTIHYYAYTIEGCKANVFENGAAATTEDALMDAGINLKTSGYIVHTDEVKKVLWLFAGASDDTYEARHDRVKASADVEKLGWTLKLSFSGLFKAAEMGQIFPRMAPGGLHKSAHSLPLAAPHARSLQQNGDATAGASATGSLPSVYDSRDVRAIHALFVQSVQSCFAFSLATSSIALPLDSRTFVLTQPSQNMSNDNEPWDHYATVFTVDHTLANGGGMLVSTCVVSSTKLEPFAQSMRPYNHQARVLVTPGSTTAMVMSNERAFDTPAHVVWKALVLRYLRTHGIALDILESPTEWLLLRTDSALLHGMENCTPETIFLWPRVLCFSVVGAQEHSLDFHSDAEPDAGNAPTASRPSSWYMDSSQSGYVNPIEAAALWQEGKANRDKIIAERKKRAIEAENARLQPEKPDINTSSPNYIREGLQPVGGVYPTPPDGVLSQAAQINAQSDLPATSLSIDQVRAHRSSLDMQHSEMMDLDVTGFGEDPSQKRPSVISRGSIDASIPLGEDDLFGDDLEDEDLRRQDITDADFSFFDEPDLPDSVMEEAPAVTGDEVEGPDLQDRPEGNAHGQQVIEGSMAQPPVQIKAEESNGADTETNGTNEHLDDDTQTKTTPLEQKPDIGTTKIDSAVVVKQEPLTPAALRKKLLDFAITPTPARPGSQFTPLAFNSMVQSNDRKYSLDGAFAFDGPASSSAKLSAASPHIKPLPPEGKKRRLSAYPTQSATAPLQEVTYEEESSSDLEDSSEEDSETMEFSSTLVSPTKASTGEHESQWDPSADGTDYDHFDLAPDIHRILIRAITDQPLLSSWSRETSWFLGSISEHAGRDPLGTLRNAENPLSPLNKDFINVAQLVTEQLSIGFVNALLPRRRPGLDLALEHNNESAALRALLDSLRPKCVASRPCDLLQWVSIQEDPLPSKKSAPKTPATPAVTIQNAVALQTKDGHAISTATLFPLGPPHLRVRRGDGLWDVLPPALNFWEQLGLAPASGRKTVMAFCIYPKNADLRSDVATFLDHVGAAFESCRLGTHVRAVKVDDFSDGLVPVSTCADANVQAIFEATREACVTLGKKLAKIDFRGNNIDINPPLEDSGKIDSFVIYLVNPFRDESQGLPHLCAAFWSLYETYRKFVSSPKLSPGQPDVVLQILPIHCLAEPHTAVIMSSSFYQDLAREVYDRCPPALLDMSPSRLPIEAGAAVQLEHLLRKPDFKLQATGPVDVMHENSVMHLGYARSNNGEWLSAAWSDVTGKYQSSASYCMVGGRTFAEVARVIWQSTTEILQARRVSWRLFIARLGPLSREEIDAWSTVATSPCMLSISTMIFSIDPNPAISIFQDSPATAANKQSTPVSTPNPSPDPVLTPAATPNTISDTGPDVVNDPDAHLVDMGDESFGLILAHRPNVSGSVLDWRASMITGILLKARSPATAVDDKDNDDLLDWRGSATGDASVPCIAVHLVWAGRTWTGNPSPNTNPAGPPTPSPFDATATAATNTGPPSNLGQPNDGVTLARNMAETFMKDYLQNWRNMGTLARARGLRATRRGLLAWHVVVAGRAVEGLAGSYGRLV